MRPIFCLAVGCSAAAIYAGAAPAQAQARQFDIPEQDLAAALKAFATASGREVVAATAVIAGKRSAAVAGDFDAPRALALLLVGTGLRAEQIDGAFVIRPSATAGSGAGATGADAMGGEVVVTGTRIRGAAPASTAITITRNDMAQTGQSDLAAVVRALPQNFSGGQNPGIGFNVPESAGGDVGGGASFNLRGLGSDATLTLLNGRRLSYSGPTQSIDATAIPFGAIARVEVVPDGASALFGSDAVAGVVNIILRQDLEGFELSGRLAGSTDGGNFQQQYAATGGAAWANGRGLIALEHGASTAIKARQRTYAATRSPGLTLFPKLRHDSAIVTARQELDIGLRLDLDAGYNKRWSDSTYPLNAAGDLTISRGTSVSVARSLFIAPALNWAPIGAWRFSLAGSYGEDKVAYGGDLFYGTTRIDPGSGYYRGRSRTVELSADGPLFEAPGGTAKLALGTGFRRNSFARVTTAGATQDIDRTQDNYYAFVEMRLPLLAARDGGSGDRLAASVAARYERYPGIGEVVTPKVGLVYAPLEGLHFKASWGRSFRAPTLYQQYQPRLAYLFPAASLGAAGQPPAATAILIAGGSDTLLPERSTNWSATVEARPQAVPGLSLELSYFSVRYRDRIVTPIPFFSVALADPAYAGQITNNPSAGLQSSVIERAASFLNLTGNPYDPDGVIAIADNSSVNAGRQRARGIDALVRYRSQLGATAISATINASYLTSDQRIGPGQSTTKLAGRLFSPPHVRSRAELGATRGPFGATVAVNYSGPVWDARTAVPVRIAGMTPVDLTVRYVGAAGRRVLDGLTFTFSLQNLFNDKPSPIATSLFYDTPYDSTNHSPFGRVISLMVQKTW